VSRRERATTPDVPKAAADIRASKTPASDRWLAGVIIWMGPVPSAVAIV
jgi:hypothetical protein